MSDAERITHALGGKWNGSQGICCCPAHEDEQPSLSLSTGRDGKLIYHCFAGCLPSNIKAALETRGLLPTKDRRQPHPPINKPDTSSFEDDYDRFCKARAILRAAAKSGKQPVEYLRNRGIENCPENAMLMSAVDSRRLLDVGFPAMVLPIAKDGLLIGAHVTSLTKDATAKLERQAGAVKKTYGPIKGGFVQLGEIDPDGELIVAEGVETTLSAMQLSGKAGVAAISASNMPAVELPDGPDIIVCADADDAGVEAAEKLTKRLAMTGRRVRKAVLDGDPGYDFNDALRAGDDAAAKAIEGAKLIRKPTRVEAITMEEFMELIFPKKEHMLSPWLETSSLAMVHAYRGVAKTWFCLGVARAVARGEDFMDWKCRSAGRVLYVDGEMPGGTLQKRLKALGDIPAGNLHVLSREQFALMQQDMPDLGTEEGREVLDRIIERADPKLIILDSESTLVRTGFENDADSWRPLQAWIMKHRWRGRTLIYVVHDGLSGRARGTTKREDVMDTSIGLKLAKEQTPDETTIELAFDKHRNFFGQDAEPRVLTFRVSDDDVEWEMEMQRDERKERIAQMLHDGWKQKDIAKELGLTEGRVSQIKKEIEADQAPRLKTGENVVPFKGRDDL